MNKKRKDKEPYANRQIPNPPPTCQGIIYTVQKGDTLYIISTRFGTPLADIITANPQIKDPNIIFTGQQICIPLPPPPPICSGFYHTVASGENLVIISQRYGVRVVDIVIANPQIVNPQVIFTGQIICIPIPPPAAIECPGTYYTVLPGETLNVIAQRFSVTVHQILVANPQIIDPNKIFAGQVICIPVPKQS